MLSQILDFGFLIVISLGSSFLNEAVFSQIFLNGMKTTAIEQQSLRHELINNLVDTSFDTILNEMELDDLEKIINEFAQGLPSDTEWNPL